LIERIDGINLKHYLEDRMNKILRYVHAPGFVIAGLCLFVIGINLSNHYGSIIYVIPLGITGILFFLLAWVFFIISSEENNAKRD